MRLPRLVSVIVLVSPAFGAAQDIATTAGARMRPEVSATASAASAVRAAHAPVIDGALDDAIWAQAPVIDQFLEYEPNEGAETRFKTEARVAYDDKYLYIMVRMHDPAPDSIVSLLSRRDVRTASEQLKLVIDSYHDRRTAYQFAVNPAGVKRDFYVYNDNVEDGSWDAVWDVATAIDSLGWTAEFRIPFSQLRFANRAEHTFGLMIVRDVARTGARISWPLFRRNVQGYVSQAGEIGGFRGIPSPRRLEVLPYVVTKNVTDGSDATGYSHHQQTTGGADVKYGLSSNLTLDATMNPDFGQVEADPAVLNLSAFETFFEERRPFFLEGSGIFSFRTACDDIDTGCTGLFYSRRVGRSPQLLDAYGDDRSPTATTIIGAAKVTGRLGSGLSVGLLDAVTEREAGVGDQTIEPRTNYLVARAQQALNNDQSDVGVMFTAVNRDLDDLTSPFLRRAAYTGGLDLRHRFLDRQYEMAASIAGSHLSGSPAAIDLTQRSSVHYYQRPDAGLVYDPTRTSLAGDMQRISLSKFGGGNTRFQSVYQRFSPGFESNDVGFLQRADEQMFRNWFALQYNTPSRLYRRAFFNFNYWQFWNTAGMPLSIGLNQNSHVQFNNQMWGHFGVNYGNFAGNALSDRESRGGPAVRRSRDMSFWAGVEGDNRKQVTPQLWWGGGRSDEGRSSYWYLNPSVQFRASSRFSASVSANYQRTIDDNQFRGRFGDVGSDTTHHTFARLDQTTLSLTTRLNLTLTPALSFQFYGQPFVSAGTYEDWRELDDPRAKRYEDRYREFTLDDDPGGFNFKQFQSNSVVRWEYRPGSTLFFVWQQGRDGFIDGPSRFDFRQDYQDLFGLHPKNTFLVKASYWFNP
ncbi:MAG: carbohydrate binding family 9 domain-containing protein [Gemmatimonadota bacterium]|nr:carbohydrate binding family 9 domain-containing protein [Gemmatimonadota bacterium]